VTGASFVIESVVSGGNIPTEISVTGNIINGGGLGGGISIPNSTYSVYANNVINNGSNTTAALIEVGGDSATFVSVIGNIIEDGGIAFFGMTTGAIMGNVIDGTQSTINPIGLGQNPCTDVIISGNIVNTSGDANNPLIALGNAGSATQINRIVVSNNILRNGGGRGIVLAASASSTEIVIRGNFITDCASYGIAIAADSNHDEVTIADNYLVGNTAGAILNSSTGGDYRFFHNIPDDGVTSSITAVGSTISNQGERVLLTADASYTLTSAPTIADGYNGQILEIMNVDTTDTITIQDQGTLPSSNLRLGAATRALAPRDNIRLRFDTTIGDWVEVGFVNVT
jgi:hypothetical protein